MPNYRESISRTLRSSLSDGPGGHERPIDRVRAWAKAETLGRALWRLKYDADSEALPIAVSELISLTGYNRDLIELSLHEWIADQCRTCGGKQQMVIGERTIVCKACAAHPGIHRFSDRERAAYLKQPMSYVQKRSKQISRLADLLGTFDRQVNATMAVNLSD